MQFNRIIIFLLTFALYSVSGVNPLPSSNDNDAGYFMNCYRPEWLTKVWDFSTHMFEGRQAKEDRDYGKFCIELMINSIERSWDRSTSNQVTIRINQCYCGIFLGDAINAPGVAKDAMTILNQVASTIDKHGIPKTGYIEEKTTGFNQSNIFGIAIQCADDRAWLLDKMAHFETSMTRSII